MDDDINTDPKDYGPGPWDEEPDHERWVHEPTGLACLVRRTQLGHLCGYVGVPPEHPLYGVDYGLCAREAHGLTCEDPDHEYGYCKHEPVHMLEVHGGVTYASERPPGDDEDDGPEWWFGFDCAHLGDVVPSMDNTVNRRSTYRDFKYVRRETESLADQLAAVDLELDGNDGSE